MSRNTRILSVAVVTAVLGVVIERLIARENHNAVLAAVVGAAAGAFAALLIGPKKTEVGSHEPDPEPDHDPSDDDDTTDSAPSAESDGSGDS